MRCTSDDGAEARYLVSAGDNLLLMLCPNCLAAARQLYRRADARPLRRGA